MRLPTPGQDAILTLIYPDKRAGSITEEEVSTLAPGIHLCHRHWFACATLMTQMLKIGHMTVFSILLILNIC